MTAAVGPIREARTRNLISTPIAVLAVLLVGCAVLAPVALNNYWLRLATTLMMYIVLAGSWNFIGGFVGYPSFGIAAFFGFGAYSGAILLTAGLPFWLSPVAGAVTSAAVAGLIGMPILRLRGHYFAVASLGIGEVFREVAMSWTDLTGGGMGLNLPPFGLSWIADAQLCYYGMCLLAILLFASTVLVSRSKLGTAFRCIRQNEEAANMIGINATYYKVIAFMLSASFAGAAGAIYASWIGYIDATDVFDIINSVKAPVMVLLGGAGTVFGPLIGAAVYLVFEQTFWANFLNFSTGMLGLVIVALILFMPNGILSALQARKVRSRA